MKAICRTAGCISVALLLPLMTAGPSFADTAAISTDVSVPGGVDALARALGIESADRARLVPEFARLLYSGTKELRKDPDSKWQRFVRYVKAAGTDRRTALESDFVPMPLTPILWSDSVFHRPVAAGDLFVAVMSSESAALLAHGLASLDDETLEYIAARGDLVAWLHDHGSAFAIFAAHLRIRGARIVPPGGDAAAPSWEAVLNERVREPDRFIRALFSKYDGRAAYLYDTIGHLDGPRASFGLGRWIADESRRIERFKDLAEATAGAFPEWRIARHPFTRPGNDLYALLSHVQVADSGMPLPPASRELWIRAFGDDRSSEPDTSDAIIDAAWLTRAALRGNAHVRLVRVDQFAFAARVFSGTSIAVSSDVMTSIRTFPALRALMLTLERIGVRRPAIYAAAARQAERIAMLDGSRAHTALAQFQGAIALVDRLVRVRTLDRPTAESLLASLVAVPIDQAGRYAGAIARWMRADLGPALGERSVTDASVVEAMAGRQRGAANTLVAWEGAQYRIDLVGPALERLRLIRERQDDGALDAALNLETFAESLGAFPPTAALAEPLQELVDVTLADALVALAYAVGVIDADDGARFVRGLAARHDFWGASPPASFARSPWAIPQQVVRSGTPWHIDGAILGLDVALASTMLQHITTDLPPGVPTLESIDAVAFTMGVALLNPFELDDQGRDAIAESTRRGLDRLASLRGPHDALALADEVRLDGWRRRAIQWTIVHEPDQVTALFSAAELVRLGGGDHNALHAWGSSALDDGGCLCLRLADTSGPAALAGRRDQAALAGTVADLNLRVAALFQEMQLPAAIAKAVLAFAEQDFLDRVRPNDQDDWMTLVRTARALSREQVEDYVAATIGRGPLVRETRRSTVEWKPQ